MANFDNLQLNFLKQAKMKGYNLIGLVCLEFLFSDCCFTLLKKQEWAMTLDGKNSVFQPKCVL